MTSANIIEVQKRIGVTPDGFFGPKSIAAAQKHLRGLMPKTSPWPATDQPSLTKFYGNPGDESRLTNLPAPVPIFYHGKQVQTLRCHQKVADSLGRVLIALGSSPYAYLLTAYDGCFNDRKMRGGSLPSLHARGAATDFDADNNGNKSSWPARATMPFEVMEMFAREGWVAAGAFWGRDAMHFQATRI